MRQQLFNPVIPDVNALYASMAAKLGTLCICTVCRRRQRVDPATCLRRGWLMCCGRTMRLEPKAGGK